MVRDAATGARGGGPAQVMAARGETGSEALAGRWRLRLPPFQHTAGRGRSPDGARRRRGNWTGGGAELDEGPLSAGLKRI